MIKYGVFIGRFQPLHSGHIDIINYIKSLGYTPIILIGVSSDKSKNPIPIRDAINHIHNKFPDCHIQMIKDQDDNLLWIKQLDNILYHSMLNVSFTLFTHNKPSEAGKYGLSDGQFYSDLIVKHSTQITSVIDLIQTFPNFDGKSATVVRSLISKALTLAPKDSIELLLKHT